MAAATVAQLSSRAAELFARGLLPQPDALLPAPKNSDEVEISWINRPEDGRMSRCLFLDGSGRGGRSEALRRAGWAVAQVDRFGQLIAAAYGAVPWDKCPGQTSRDAEDYAVAMLTLVATEPFVLYIDCQGTLDSIQSPPSITAGARGPRANLWARVWASFDSIEAHKTKAHTSALDVERGLTTEWERTANGLADKFAKKGAALHGLSAHMELEYRTLASLTLQAAKWASEQAVLQRRAKAEDAERLPERGALPKRPPKLRLRPSPPPKFFSLQGVLAADCCTASSTRYSSSFLAHNLRIADVSFKGSVVFCAKCGAYAWANPRALLQPCPGRASTAGRAAQKSRIANGKYPSSKRRHWRLGQARPATEAVVSFLTAVAARRGDIAPKAGASGAALDPAVRPLSRADLLARFGLTEHEFQALAQKTLRLEEARKMGPREEDDPDYFQESASESDSSVQDF